MGIREVTLNGISTTTNDEAAWCYVITSTWIINYWSWYGVIRTHR
jgi:hypothetical protein